MTYLLGAVLLSALLTWLVVWWHRRPKSMERAIDDFRKAREAIAPRAPEDRRRSRGDGDDGGGGPSSSSGRRRR